MYLQKNFDSLYQLPQMGFEGWGKGAKPVKGAYKIFEGSRRRDVLNPERDDGNALMHGPLDFASYLRRVIGVS